MPIDFEYDEARGILHAVVTTNGMPNVALYRHALERITSNATYPPSVPIAWDLRALDFTFFDSEVIRSMASILDDFPARRISRTAYVVSNELGFGMMRMLQVLSDMLGTSMVFYDYAEAVQWVSAGPQAFKFCQENPYPQPASGRTCYFLGNGQCNNLFHGKKF